jgi:hypothetical protein
LQRVVTDFAADLPFAQAMDKLVEHYGVLLNESTVRRITEGHARKVFEMARPEREWPRQAGCAVVVAETDGGMVPIMEPGTTGTDRRKGKRLFWKEARICLAHAQGSRTPVHGGTLQGDVNQVGEQLFHCALKAGFGQGSRLHAVGDGAEWIATQVERQFGANGRYLLDFYHVCDYLGAAAKALCPDRESASDWLSIQKDRLRSQRAGELMRELADHIEAPDTVDAEAPVRCCHRYLSHRMGQLDYQSALADGLPIGSGEIESAHRYLIQQRLKRPGAWWQAANAEHMIALRILRANGLWKSYWSPDRLAA